jgi:iron complex outermembrane receptor protein
LWALSRAFLSISLGDFMSQKAPQFRRSLLARSVLIACGATASVLAIQPVLAQDASKELQRVEITGSLIKRAAAEGPAPVETISRKEIEKTGATSVNELLKSIPSIDIFDQGELASNSPSGSGTANIRMRGLDESNVLVLLNGRRLPVNALYDSSGAGAAVDINMIPIGSIERVEILKDGGSAIYGADAVAGVVNFITKKNYRGLEISADLGSSSRGDGSEKSVGIAGGAGNYDEDNYNILFALNMFKRDPIYRKDRDISKSVDFRRLGGSDGRSSFSPYGNYVDPATFGFTGDTYRPCPPELLTNRCRFDFNASVLTAYNGADRWGGLVVGAFKLSSDIKAIAEVSYSESKDHFEAQPVPDFFAVPSGTGLIAGRFMQGGPRITDRLGTSNNIVLGLEGSTGKIDWDVSMGQGVSKVTNNDSGYYDANLWAVATGNGSIDPTVSTNDPALVESLKVRPTRTGESKTQHVTGKFTGELMQMANGPLGYAVGASFWNESLVDTPDALSQAGLVTGSVAQAAANASRNAHAVFAEFSIPAMKNLEVQLAARFDEFENASKLSPKVAARYEVSPALILRGSYAESFKMPALKQLFGAKEQGAVNINNETGAPNCQAIGQPADCDISAWQINGSNDKLKPEKGVTWNLGTAFEVGKSFSGTVDIWQITKSDNITTPTVDDAISQGLLGRDPVDNRWLVFTNLSNQAKRLTSGIDVDLRSRLPSIGQYAISLRNATTYYLKDSEQESPTSGWKDNIDTYATPRLRNTASVTVDMGAWSSSLAWRYVGGFLDATDPTPTTMRVPSYEEFDVVASYSGIKSLRLSVGVKNLLDTPPPYSKLNGSNNAYTQMGFAELYSSRGRFFYANLNYAFR